MATFAQWFKSFQKRDKLPRFTFICGSDRVLVDYAYNVLKTKIAADNIQNISIVASDVRDICVSLESGVNSLVTIRDAELLPDDFAEKLKLIRSPNEYIVMVSNEVDFIRNMEGELSPIIKATQFRGSIIKCAELGNAADQWVSDLCPAISSYAAQYLVERLEKDSGEILNTIKKLNILAPSMITTKTIDAIVDTNSTKEFVDYLLHDDKIKSLSAGEGDLLRDIRLLDSRLDMMSSLYKAFIAKMSVRDICEKYKLSDFLVRRYLPLAKSYDRARVNRNKRLLAALEEAVLSGSSEGIRESLVAVW